MLLLLLLLLLVSIRVTLLLKFIDDDEHDEEVNEPLFDGGPRDDFWVAQKRGFFEGNF